MVADDLTYCLPYCLTYCLTYSLTHSPCHPHQSASHLDGKHTVFGRVVGGLDTLTKIEKVKTDKDDKPTTEQVTRRWRHPPHGCWLLTACLLRAHHVPVIYIWSCHAR